MGIELLVGLGAAWLVANAVLGILAMLGVRTRQAKLHLEARPLTRAPASETLRDALTGDGETGPSR